MAGNTSASGGYLTPVGTAPLEGEALWDFIQTVIVGITGLDGKMVRPRWQPEPPNIPLAGDAWCAFSILDRPSDTFPQVVHVTNATYPDGADQLQRQEELNVLASFYDLGSGGLADQYAAQLRDGLVISQNREALQAQGFDFGYSGQPEPVPSLVQVRWLYRVDLAMTFRRQINRTYQVLDLKALQGTLKGETQRNTVITDTLTTTEPTP